MSRITNNDAFFGFFRSLRLWIQKKKTQFLLFISVLNVENGWLNYGREKMITLVRTDVSLECEKTFC